MRWTLFASRPVFVACLGLLLAICNGCGGPTGATPDSLQSYTLLPQPSPSPDRRRRTNKIQHVVVIIQENRSFNNLFYGYPGATTSEYGYDSQGDKIQIEPVVLETTWDLEHDSYGFFDACDGTGSIPGTDCQMNGFNEESVECGTSGFPPCPIPHPQYAYVPQSETKPYFAMAEQYVLADQMYASNLDGSFTSHQYIIAGQSEHAVNYPDAGWGCSGGPSDTIQVITDARRYNGREGVCFNPDTTLGDELDAKGISWAYYATSVSGSPSSGSGPGLWSAYQAIKHIYDGPDWSKDVINPPKQFLSDVAQGKLRAVTWVTPTAANSDHPGSGNKTGPAWVASLVNAVGESKYWDSTAIFIFWDDYGGWYDPEPPAYVDYDGLGFRVPLLVISPYAKKGYVSHVHYEHGSILKFIEDQFGLKRLAASDRRANSPYKDCFDFKQPPRPFTPIQSSKSIEYFLHEQPPDNRPVDTE
jgi:phospholipase C